PRRPAGRAGGGLGPRGDRRRGGPDGAGRYRAPGEGPGGCRSFGHAGAATSRVSEAGRPGGPARSGPGEAGDPRTEALVEALGGGVELGINEILKTLPHRYPFLLVDRILEIVPGKRAVGIKNVTFNEEFF